jgi:hypothetical protein
MEGVPGANAERSPQKQEVSQSGTPGTPGTPDFPTITTTQETDVQTTYNFTVGSKVRVWTCWSLVEVFVLLDAHGNETTYNGRWEVIGGAPAPFPANRFVNRTPTVYPDYIDFD